MSKMWLRSSRHTRAMSGVRDRERFSPPVSSLPTSTTSEPLIKNPAVSERHAASVSDILRRLRAKYGHGDFAVLAVHVAWRLRGPSRARPRKRKRHSAARSTSKIAVVFNANCLFLSDLPVIVPGIIRVFHASPHPHTPIVDYRTHFTNGTCVSGRLGRKKLLELGCMGNQE